MFGQWANFNSAFVFCLFFSLCFFVQKQCLATSFGRINFVINSQSPKEYETKKKGRYLALIVGVAVHRPFLVLQKSSFEMLSIIYLLCCCGCCCCCSGFLCLFLLKRPGNMQINYNFDFIYSPRWYLYKSRQLR